MVLFLTLLMILQTSPDSSHADSSSTNVESELNIEEGYYKQLYEETKDFNDRVLNTIYWSVGSMLGVILLIIGGNIYLNFRYNSNQLNTIRKERDDQIRELENELKLYQNSSFDEFKKAFRIEFNQSSSDLNESLSNNLNFLKTNLSERIENTNHTINQIKEDQEKYRTEISDKQKSFSKENYKNYYLIQAVLWYIEGTTTNALRYILNAYEYKKESKESTFLDYYLIEKFLDNINFMLKSDFELLESVLNSWQTVADESDLERISRIRERMKKIETLD